MELEIGSIAPDFTLFDTDKNQVTLSILKGQKILLLFFPLAFTSTCTKELCAVRDNITAYNEANVKVLGISVDSLFTLKKYKEEQAINFLLLSDFNKEVSTTYETLYEEFTFGMKGVSKRSAYLISETGQIIYKEVLENASEVPDFVKINGYLST